MLSSFIEKMGTITDGVMSGKDLQVEPLPQLLIKHNSQISWTDGIQFVVPLPASEYHSYVFPGAEWGRESWKGALIHTVPFYHPGHVPALLNVLRHQSAVNVLLESCFSDHNHHIDAGLQYDLRCEVLPESDHCLSVTFSLDDSNHLAVLQVTVADAHQMSCRLMMPDFVDHKLDDYISRVLMRMNIYLFQLLTRRRRARDVLCRAACIYQAIKMPLPEPRTRRLWTKDWWDNNSAHRTPSSLQQQPRVTLFSTSLHMRIPFRFGFQSD